MKLNIACLGALYLQRATTSPKSLALDKAGGLSTALDSTSTGASSNDSATILARSDRSGDVEMGGIDDRDYMIQGTPPRNPSPIRDPILAELTETDAQALIQKGAKLYAWMSEPNVGTLTQLLRQDNKLGPEACLQSDFTTYPQDLVDAGWDRDPLGIDAPLSDFQESIPLKLMVDGLGISTTWEIPPDQQGDNEYVTWHHTDPNFDGTDHGVATGAFYSIVYNTKDGVIMLVSNYGPRKELPSQVSGEYQNRGQAFMDKFIADYQYPALSHVSDVSALEYNGQCKRRNHNAKDLNKLIMVSSQSDVSVQVVDYLLKKKGIQHLAPAREYGRYKAPAWPQKIRYLPGSDGFKLLLANPNGNLATFLLIQHRQEFGLKRVGKIDVFDDDHYDHSPQQGYKGASMAYYLEDLDSKGKPVVKAGASGSGAGKKPLKTGGSGGRTGKSGKIEKPKRPGLRSGGKVQRMAKL